MTPQSRVRTRRAAVGLTALAAATMFTLAGCDPRTLSYFFGDGAPQIPGEAPSLEGKKVVLVTTATPAAAADFSSVDRDLNREVATLLRETVKKITLVDSQKVTDWLRSHPTWSDPGELAKAFEADYVVFFEISQFSIEDPRSPGMLEGNVEVHIRVSEFAHPKGEKGKPNKSAPKEVNQVFEDEYKNTFPKNAPVSLGPDISRPKFKSKFLKITATELSWRFLGHNPGDDIGQDQRF
jgi:hypothetical protein